MLSVVISDAEVCWSDVGLAELSSLPHFCCVFYQKVHKVTRGKDLGVLVSARQLHNF